MPNIEPAKPIRGGMMNVSVETIRIRLQNFKRGSSGGTVEGGFASLDACSAIVEPGFNGTGWKPVDVSPYAYLCL